MITTNDSMEIIADAKSNAMHENMLAAPLLTTVMYYAASLLAAAKALAYLADNCLSSNPSLKVGFSDRSLGNQLPSPRLKPGRELRTQLQDVGVLRETGHETFRGMVTVPLVSTSGAVTGIYGRRIDRHALGPAEHTIGSGIFNGEALAQFAEVIVTDNILDAWTFYSAGYTNAICPVRYTFQIANLAYVKRVLLASASIDCEAFTNCEIFQLRFPTGQSAHQYVLAQRDSGSADPLGAVIRAAGWQSGVSFQLANSANSDGKQDAYPTSSGVSFQLAIEQPMTSETVEVSTAGVWKKIQC